MIFSAPDFPDRFFPEIDIWTDHTTRVGRERNLYRWSTIGKFYNGGTLRELKDWCGANYNEVPEWVIWKVIAELARAIAYLQLGYLDGQPLPANWDPIMHRNIGDSNILLHWEDDETNVPQIILAGFSLSSRLSDTEFPRGSLAQELDDDSREIYEDIQALGVLIARMIDWQEDPQVVMGPKAQFLIDMADYEANVHDVQQDVEPYSDDVGFLMTELYLQSGEDPPQNYPDGNYLINHVIPLADRKLQELQDTVEVKSIKEGRPIFNSNLHFVVKEADLMPEPDSQLNLNPRLKPYELVRADIETKDGKAPPGWAVGFRSRREHVAPWLPPFTLEGESDYEDDTESEAEDLQKGDLLRIVDSKIVQGGYARYLTERHEYVRPKWLLESEIMRADKEDLIDAYHVQHPVKQRGR